jgi:hypothetical protein
MAATKIEKPNLTTWPRGKWKCPGCKQWVSEEIGMVCKVCYKRVRASVREMQEDS